MRQISSKAAKLREPHLTLIEVSLLPGTEWTPGSASWSIIQVGSGTGYWLRSQVNEELQPGTALLMANPAPGTIRASQLGGLTLNYFNVEPERLAGVITLSEQGFLQTAASRNGFSVQIHAPGSPVALRMKELCASRNGVGLSSRLQLLKLFIDAFGNEIEQAVTTREVAADAKDRLREFLNQTSASDLLHMRFGDLVQVTRCTPRHLSRIFHEVVGMSFRDKRAELRLARARELLATTESKVVHVALESGYQSLSLFNLMFSRHFRMSPGKWRQKYRNNRCPAR